MTDTLTDPKNEALSWNPHVRVDKWHRTEDFEAGLPADDFIEVDGNLLLNAGITRLLNLLIGSGATAFNTANTRIGVGDSATAATAAQTDLQAATNKYYKLVTSAPSVSGSVATFVAAFGSAVANFVWAEWGIDNGTADSATGVAPMLNRKVAALGTKASGSTWTFTVTITVS